MKASSIVFILALGASIASESSISLNYVFLNFSDEGRIDYDGSVNGTSEYHVEFAVDSETLERKSLRVTSRIMGRVGLNFRHRVSVAVRHSRGQFNWDLEYSSVVPSKEIIRNLVIVLNRCLV